jgi:AcrR family transcriptional regulator
MSEADDTTELPPPLDLLWGRRSGPERPRKAGLSAEQLAAAGIELADAEGLDAVSMSRVAKRLGYTTMAPYRHVRSKDELMALVVDVAVGESAEEAEPGPAGWRGALERWSWDLLAVVRRHPWLLALPLSTMPFGPRRLAWLDRGLAALGDTGLSEDEKAAVVLLLNGYVFSEARLAEELADPARARGPAGSSVSHPLVGLVDGERFPALRRAVDAGIFSTGADKDADFAFGLERVLDGVEQLIAR